jgi:hypothetical protein
MKLYLADTSTNLDVALAEEGMRDMKIYLADGSLGMNNHHAAHEGCRERGGITKILLSYHYFKKHDLHKVFEKHFTRPYPELFLDSGAFSAFTQGEKINIKEYCAYIRKYKELITTYSNLDVIGSAQGTLDNQKMIEAEGLRPLPVFHTGEDWKYLDEYIDRYSYVALGGMVPYLGPAKRRTLITWLLQCFKKAHKKSVYHGFGCTAWEIIKAFPWYSVDSSSWGTGFRYGKISLFDSKQGKFVDAQLGNHHSCYRSASLFRELGFDPSDFADRAQNSRKKNCAVAAVSYLNAERWAEKRHGVITIPERNEVSL